LIRCSMIECLICSRTKNVMFLITKRLIKNTSTSKGHLLDRYFGKDLAKNYQGCVAVVFKDYSQ